MASIELDIDDLEKETQEKVSRDLKEKIEELKNQGARDFEIKHYEVIVRKLEVYGDVGE